jgi:dTMP kinase
MSTGKLIVFEGAEGAGKTTQVRLLAEALGARGIDVIAVREPGGTVLGDEIRRLLLDPASDIDARAEALLFMASRAQLVARSVRPALDQEAVVLLDRFFLSTYAYQCAGRGLPEEEIRAANRLATEGLVPDLTILLTFPVHEGLARAEQRGERDRMERAAGDFHERVAAAFNRFASAAWQSAHPECGSIVSVDATGSEHEVFVRVVTALTARWPASFPVDVVSGAAG